MDDRRRLRLRAAAAVAAMTMVAMTGGTSMAFDVQGHRGARGLAPENTLEGFSRALSLGVTTLEMDTGMTADGVVVVMHDPALNPDITRGPDGGWIAPPGPAVRSLDLAGLQRFDVGRIRPGTRYAALYPDQVPHDGARVPTLEAVLRLAAAASPTVRFNIETKVFPDRPHLTVAPEVLAAGVADALARAGLTDRAVIQSFDWRSLAWLKANRPEVARSYLTSQSGGHDTVSSREGRPSPWLAGLDATAHGNSAPRLVAAAGGSIWSPNHRDLTEESLAEARRLGLTVLPWTVNDAPTMARLIGWGVDGIITDRPDILRGVLASRGLPLPEPAAVPAK
ncbi:glycerophosphodiester phosphodiesterase [Elioraea rosea]|uniref:glycerophosphodiester phosphodiesterase n=1 Tax=Elioraea rosea TaxID=2492390 RepID=UPI001EF4FFAD|nr:glycerophosphodiester phosphodiesterase [Elioraea rosea]